MSILIKNVVKNPETNSFELGKINITHFSGKAADEFADMVTSPSHIGPPDQKSLPLQTALLFGNSELVSEASFAKKLQAALSQPGDQIWQQKLQLIANALANNCKIGLYHYNNE